MVVEAVEAVMVEAAVVIVEAPVETGMVAEETVATKEIMVVAVEPVQAMTAETELEATALVEAEVEGMAVQAGVGRHQRQTPSTGPSSLMP